MAEALGRRTSKMQFNHHRNSTPAAAATDNGCHTSAPLAMSFSPPFRRGSTDSSSTFLQPRSASFRCSFQGGGFSLSQLRFSSLGLYGRDEEVMQLHKAHEQAKGRKGIVMLTGYTGAGKSAMVKKFRDDLERTSRQQQKPLFFASGKFGLHHRTEPYTALISAFTQLVDKIVALERSDPDLFSQMREYIVAAVGSEGGVLSSIIPNLEQLTGKESTAKCDSEYESSMAKNRFNFVLRQFIRAVCTKAHPLILFLDDLQWADVASLDLIETIMSDSQLSGMLLVGCYRENEVSESHPLAFRLFGFKKDNPQDGESDICVSFIHVGDLDVDSVHELITDVLNASDKQKTLTLATTVHEKTHGNIFYVIEFLKMLRDEGMLMYNLGAQDWKWDDTEIKSSTRVSDNVVDLLKAKLRKHDMLVLELLKVASCLGGTFDKPTLLFVTESLRKSNDNMWSNPEPIAEDIAEDSSTGTTLTLDECLAICADEGLVDVAEGSPTKISFAHDQIQSAAFSLIPEGKKDLFQHCVGEFLVERLAESGNDVMLFVAVDLLNHGYDLISADEKRLELARLNLKAGQKAMQSSAFVSAAAYLNTGIRLLGTDPWKLDYHLTLSLFNAAMSAEYCKGNFEQVYRYADVVTNLEDIPIKHKLGAYQSLVQCLGDQGEPGKALEICLSVLAQLGNRYDHRFGKLSAIVELVIMKRMFKKNPLSSFDDIPVVEDEYKLKEAKLMSTLGTLITTVNPDLIPLQVLKCLQWTVRDGMSQFSPLMFVGYGVLSVACFGNLKEADEFGRYGVSLSRRFGAKAMQSHTNTAYLVNISHWVVPLQLVRKEVLQAYELALQAGDINHAMISICFFCCVCYITGSPLSELEADFQNYCQQMETFGQRTIKQLAVVIWQTALNLMSCSDDVIELNGSAMDLATHTKHCTDSVHTLFAIKSHQLQLAYLFGRFDLASELIDRNAKKMKAPSMLVWRHMIFEGLVAFALAREGKNRRKWKKFALKVVTGIRRLVSKGHVNLLHSLYLMEAEVEVQKGDTDKAKRNYDLAIATAGRAGFRVDKAISLERAGEFFLGRDDQLAAHYLSLAREQYIEWEASAKADQLLRKHANLFESVHSQEAGTS